MNHLIPDGLIHCKMCGNYFVRTVDGYDCVKCDAPSIPVALIDDSVWQDVRQQVNRVTPEAFQGEGVLYVDLDKLPDEAKTELIEAVVGKIIVDYVDENVEAKVFYHLLEPEDSTVPLN